MPPRRHAGLRRGRRRSLSVMPFGWPCRFVVVQGQANPALKVALGSDSSAVDVHVTAIPPPLHDYSLTARAFQRGIVEARVDAAHEPVSTHADTHLPSNHEDDTAEHPLLFDVDGASEGRPHAAHQSIFRRHCGFSPRATSDRARCRSRCRTM